MDDLMSDVPAEMRAAVSDRYGSPEQLRVEHIVVPAPQPDQVLVRVVATSINLSDWECLVGSPLYARIGGLRRPACPVLGSDIAGTVVAVGADVARFVVGDEVYGDNLALKGGFAEYAVAPETALAVRPPELSADEAATLPQSAAIAAQGMAGVTAGTRVLLNGAGGGSGTLAIPLAKLAGAHVTAVDNAAKLDYLRSLGADEVIDYRSTDPFRTDDGYDLILDMVAHRSPFTYRRALAPGGRYRCVGGSIRTMLGVATVGAFAARITGRRIGVLGVREGPKAFVPVVDRCVAGEIEPHIDRVVGLDEIADAMRAVGDGRALGKVVVRPG